MIPIIVDLGINETRKTGAVGNRTYRVGVNAVENRTYPDSLGQAGFKTGAKGRVVDGRETPALTLK